jgi:hypothetical protein
MDYLVIILKLHRTLVGFTQGIMLPASVNRWKRVLPFEFESNVLFEHQQTVQVDNTCQEN